MLQWAGPAGRMTGSWVDKIGTGLGKTEKQLKRGLKMPWELPETRANGTGKAVVVGCDSVLAEAEVGVHRDQLLTGARKTGKVIVVGKTDPYPYPCEDWPKEPGAPTHCGAAMTRPPHL